jgi:hypothetical protein
VTSQSPLLLVALVGFDAARHAQLARLLDDCCALAARWRAAAPPEADLWIVDGASARKAGATVDVAASPPLRFRPHEMRQPVVFARPLHASLAGQRALDSGSMHALNVMLTQLAPALSPLLVQQALVAHLVANGASFTRSNVIHVRDRERLLAVLDFNGETAVAPYATQAAIRRADWLLEPRGEWPRDAQFRTASTEEVLWRFAARAEHGDLLPRRYLRLPIYLRRMPKLPPRELADRQLALLRELAYAPRTLAELGDRLGANEQALRRDLGALYLIGTITCDPGRSRATRDRRRAAMLGHDLDDLSIIGAAPSDIDELTAPGFARRG